MIKRIAIGNYRLTFTFARVARVVGVNSELDDGRHILMWDFDDVPLDKVKEALRRVQTRFFLSDIIICETKELKNYIAYCFTAKEWKEAVMIVAQTEHIDWQFFRFGVYRGHFTLRVSPKNSRFIRFAARMEGYEPPDCSVDELNSWVKYETSSWR